jgi:hypothetical protein
MFPFGLRCFQSVSISKTGKLLVSKGLRKCFQCFHIFQGIGPEYIKSSLQVSFKTLQKIWKHWKHLWKPLKHHDLTSGRNGNTNGNSFRNGNILRANPSLDPAATRSDAAPEASDLLHV